MLMIGLLFIFTFQLQGKEKIKKNKVSVLPVPAIGYSPETKFYAGAVSLFTFRNINDTLTRTSNAEIEVNYTWNRQLILESGWNYFFPEEKWFSRGKIHYSKYPDLYYGVGAFTTKNQEVSFQSRRFIIDVEFFRNFKKNLFIGLGMNYKNYSGIEYLNDQLVYQELNSQISKGLRISLLFENRDAILSPSKGSFFEFNHSFNFSSDFYYIAKIDFRKYYTLGKSGHQILAGRIFHTSVFGDPPFYDYALIGGDEFVRAYYLGRFRDKNFSTIQFEYRTAVVWKLGLAAFGGFSSVFGTLKEFERENIKPNIGFGIRFLIDEKEKTNLRIDYALGVQKQSGIYISFGESF